MCKPLYILLALTFVVHGVSIQFFRKYSRDSQKEKVWCNKTQTVDPQYSPWPPPENKLYVTLHFCCVICAYFYNSVYITLTERLCPVPEMDIVCIITFC